MELQIFVVLATCMTWRTCLHGHVEVESLVRPLIMVKHLLLHVNLLLNVRFTVLVFISVVLVRKANGFRTTTLLLFWRSPCMTTVVMAVRCVSISFRRNFRASYHGVVGCVQSLILCWLANHWTVTSRNCTYQQTVEITVCWASLLLASGSLRAWS